MKILVADDDIVSRRALQAPLAKWGYQVVLAEDGRQAEALLHAPDAPQLAILDWLMPGLDGPQLCRKIRAQGNEPYRYILLLTSKRSKEEIIAGLEAGADDYITKPFNSQELKVRLNTGKRILFLQEQLIASREALREIALRDPLTGLSNRTSADEIIAAEVARAHRLGTPCGVVLADIDFFKKVNDRHGHLVGDAVLKQVSSELQTAVRPYDAVCRYGGEEFLLILPGCDAANSLAHAERLCRAIRRLAIAGPAGPLGVTMSFGVTVLSPDPAVDASRAIQRADEALYRAKHRGRDRVELEPPGLIDSPALINSPGLVDLPVGKFPSAVLPARVAAT